jgi:sec-independent protein translocase protein TatA
MGIGGLGMWEMILIFLVVLLLFGAKRLPEIGSSLGKGIREFKGSIREIEREVQSAGDLPRESGSSSSSTPKQDDDEEDAPRTLHTAPPATASYDEPDTASYDEPDTASHEEEEETQDA